MKRSNRIGVAHINQGVHWNESHPFLRVRSTFSSTHPYETHFHDCLSLGVVFKGTTLLRRPGGAETVRPGGMVWIPPMEPHCCNPVGGRARGYHMFYIDSDWALGVLGAPPGSALAAGGGIDGSPALFAALMRLAEALREGRSDPAGCAALAEAVRTRCSFRPAPENSALRAAGELSVEARARALGMRRESFIRSFRRAAGVTPARYGQCLRLARAQELLRRGKSPVEAALLCGYADQSHFHRMCVKYLSATPAQLKPRATR